VSPLTAAYAKVSFAEEPLAPEEFQRIMAKARIVVQSYADVTVVTFSDSSILDAATIDQIGKELYRLVDEQNKQKLILDFSAVQFLASLTLGVLMTLNRKMQAIKGKLVFCGLKKELMKVFTITNLDKLFKFYPDDAAALKSFDVHVQ
jgi:anti-anti-sigma factor